MMGSEQGTGSVRRSSSAVTPGGAQPIPGFESTSIDRDGRTVTIRELEYVLDGDELRGYDHRILADTVTCRSYDNPGTNLTIQAREVIVEADGATIVVAGRDAEDGYEPGDKAGLDGIGYKADGQEGADGKPGADYTGEPPHSGAVTIHAGSIRGGVLTIDARGGTGGRGQDGGDGVEGKSNAAADGPVLKMKRPPTPDDDFPHAEKDWGKNIGIYGFMQTWYLAVSVASPGVRGSDGGNAGLAGRSGAGGGGGKVSIACDDISAEIRVESGAGDGGAGARTGEPGGGSGPQLGGRHRYLYSSLGSDRFFQMEYPWVFASASEVADLQKPKNVRGYVKPAFIDGQGKLLLRTPSGAPGESGGYGSDGLDRKPEPEPGPEGAPGDYETTDRVALDLESLDREQLLQLQQAAYTREIRGDVDAAAGILTWLARITADYREVDPSGASRAAIEAQGVYQGAVSRLRSLRSRSRGSWSSNETFRFTNLEKYSSYVETHLTHLENTERNLVEYVEHQDEVARRKRSVGKAIEQAEAFVEHLRGDLAAKQDDQLRIKKAIGDLQSDMADYVHQLENMPEDLQQAIDMKIAREAELTWGELLQYVSMALSIAGAVSALAGGMQKVAAARQEAYEKEFSETLARDSGSGIHHDDVWEAAFKTAFDKTYTNAAGANTDLVNKAFGLFKAGIDALAKYLALASMRKSSGEMQRFDAVDLEAYFILTEPKRVELAKQRNEFSAFIYAFLNDFAEAREWQRMMSDLFDMGNSRLDLVDQLSKLQADERELSFQLRNYENNRDELTEIHDELDFESRGDDARLALIENYRVATSTAFDRIVDEAAAYRIWTLLDYELPRIPGDLSVQRLRDGLHRPLWELIEDRLNTTQAPPQKDFSAVPHVWSKKDHAREFRRLIETGRMLLTLAPDPNELFFHLRLIRARIFLKGATVARGSEFRCVLRHPGVCKYVARDRGVRQFSLAPRTVQCTYKLDDATSEPDYDYPGAIKQPLMSDWKDIGYSPHTTWELKVEEAQDRGVAYNKDIDWSGLEEVQLRFAAYFDSRDAAALAVLNSWHAPLRGS